MPRIPFHGLIGHQPFGFAAELVGGLGNTLEAAKDCIAGHLAGFERFPVPSRDIAVHPLRIIKDIAQPLPYIFRRQARDPCRFAPESGVCGQARPRHPPSVRALPPAAPSVPPAGLHNETHLASSCDRASLQGRHRIHPLLRRARIHPYLADWRFAAHAARRGMSMGFAAKRKAAEMSSRSRSRKSARIVSTLTPSASISRMSLTRMRMPRMQGPRRTGPG